jgi:hypothetical protein
MSDTYGISHGRTYGHAPTSVIALFKKKGCETSPSVKARLLVPAGGDFKDTPLPGGLLQSARAPTPGTHINGQPIAEAMGYTSAKSLANKNESDIEAGLTSLR